MTVEWISRRRFTGLVGGAAAAWPFAAQAQPGKVHRIGFLGNSTAALEANLIGPFREGLRAHGYEDFDAREQRVLDGLKGVASNSGR